MEIFRQDELRPTDEYGTYAYRFRYNSGRGRGVVGGEGVLHRRLDDVWDLVRSVLNHSEPDPQYCGSCACQFQLIGDEPVPFEKLYRRIEVGPST